MKKFSLTIAAAAIALTASAYTLDSTEFWSENFVKMAQDSDYPTDGWLTLGNGAKPSGYAAQVFDADGKGPYYVIYDVGSSSIPVANTDFVGNVPADEWLISPEIEVPYDATNLYFTVYTYTADGLLGAPNKDARHSFKVMVSEGGTAKEDFTQVFSSTARNSDTADFEATDMICAINGYGGKKVRLAFVVDGTMQGWTGFTNMKWSQYYVNVDSDLTASLAEVGKPVTIDFNLKIKAPVACPKVLAQLYINGELIKEATYSKSFGAANSTKAIIQRVKMENVYTPTTDEALTYKLVLTPEFPGAIPTNINGSFGFPKFYYMNNVVIEEVTGVRCGWCPRGLGALDYYADTYKGSATQGRVINIGVHNSNLGYDPMANGMERYTTSIMELSGSTSLPGALMNRATRGLDPSNVGKVEELLKATSFNDAKIVEVAMPSGDAYDIAGQTAKVVYEVKNGYDASIRNLSAAAVLIENNVKGTSSEWNQVNYLNSYSSGTEAVSRFSSAYGATQVLAHYYAPYVMGGAMGTDPIPYSKITYEHVCRGIYPAFTGEPIVADWVADVPNRFELEFEIPANVMNMDNTEVAILIIDNDNRQIVASDVLSASSYSDVSAVGEISVENAVNILRKGNSLAVSAADGSLVEVFALDGTKLGAYTVANGNLNVAADWTGVVIVKVSNNDIVKSSKLIF